MAYSLSVRSLKALEGVEPGLVKVVKAAIKKTTQDFLVVQGCRTKEEMWANYGKGRTVAQLAAKGVPAIYAKPKEGKVTWLNDPLKSNHRVHPDGFGHAVDLVPYPVDWNDLAKFKAISVAMKAAAKELSVAMSWGGDWSGTKDYPHYETP